MLCAHTLLSFGASMCAHACAGLRLADHTNLVPLPLASVHTCQCFARVDPRCVCCSGLVIKYNQNQRYATNGVTATLFKQVAAARGIPCQAFVVRNDMPCGSTIGPILASNLGVRTIDVGIPQYAMHSIREMCGTDDVTHAYNHFVAFFEDFGKIDATLNVDDCAVVADGVIDDVPCECTGH